MLKTAQNIAGGLEQGLEHGIWGGVRGALLGYMTLPLVAGVVAAASVAAIGTPVLALESLTLSAMAVGAIATAVTAVVAYPLNKQVAKLGSVIGGVVGFTRSVDEPAPQQGQIIQLAPEQELVVVNKPAVNAVNANVTTQAKPEPVVRSKQAEILGSRVTELVHEYSKKLS